MGDSSRRRCDGQELIKKIVEWSNIARKQGLLGLEPIIEQEDGRVREARRCSWWSTAASRTASAAVSKWSWTCASMPTPRAAKVFEGMGIYSPTLGIIGAVLGLMAVMQNLADPSKLGHGIAAAFTATIYGIGLANLFFLPVAAKLKVDHPAADPVARDGDRRHVSHRAGREPARHRSEAAGLPALRS